MNPNLPQNNEIVFLDTTFLAAAFIKEHKDNSRAAKLLAQMLIKNCDMRTSVLCVYELLGVVKKVNNSLHGNKPILRKANNILRKIKLKILFEELNFSYKEIFNKLKDAVNNLQTGGYVTVLSLDQSHIPATLQSISNIGSAPGDAFHHSVIQAQGISSVVTENRRDFEPMKVKVIRI